MQSKGPLDDESGLLLSQCLPEGQAINAGPSFCLRFSVYRFGLNLALDLACARPAGIVHELVELVTVNGTV